LIVGYQAVGTIGREIEEGVKRINLFDRSIAVKAKITKIESLSSHADQPQLLTWLKQIKGVKQVFLVHGEDEQRIALKEKIKTDLGIKDIILPVRKEVFNL
jgi:metallo-beta-lactamase family protein